MSVPLNCPHCGETIDVDVESDSGAGCPDCGEDFSVQFAEDESGEPAPYLVPLEVDE